jgi:serine/threonine protein kinase/tetratricopeptide (TPR) repeat protein
MMPARPVICPACRAESAAGELFCTNCGRALSGDSAAAPPARPAPPAPPEPTRACPHCGASNPARARGCLLCGRSLGGHTHPLARALRPGRLLGGRYAVQRMLSKGGMGALFLAQDRQNGRTVVVKALGDYFDPADERQTRAARERLAQEAETLAALDHPAIPRTLGSFQDEHQVYVVMEHIAAPNLEHALTHVDTAGGAVPGQPYPQADVLRWGVALCRVLEYLAVRPEPLVHHDIKPANVLVSPTGDRVFLVDFGTAQVRLDPEGQVGLEQSSLYGTVGYAPPEQYRGRSEPRSDVYALAATLYHLATDDDPAEHPFSFPRLDALGALGEALGQALDRDVRQRPQAHELRRRLEQLLGAALRAPDGTGIAGRDALVAWCLGEWRRAAAWLYEGMPDQIELWWGDAEAAHALRRIVARQPDHDLGLDAALAALDPQGIGRERPRLTADAAAVDFGTLPGALIRRDITIENSGRRFVSLYIFLPRWVRGSSQTLALPPGSRSTLALAPDLDRLYVGGRLRGEILVRDHYGRRRQDTPLLRIRLQAFVSRRYILSRRYGLPLGGAGLALLVWAGAGFPWPQPRDVTLLESRIADAPAALEAGGAERSYRLAQGHYERGEYQAAIDQLHGHLRQYGEAPEARALLNEALYSFGSYALMEGEWQVARLHFAELLAAAPDYRDASTLLSESYYRPALASLDRGDLAGAREELRALLVRSGEYRDARAMLAGALSGIAQRAAEGGAWEAATEAALELRATDPADARVDGLLSQYPRLARLVASATGSTWESGRARRIAEIPGSLQPEAVVFSPDGTLLATCAGDGRALVRSAADGTLRLVLSDPNSGPLYDLAFSPDGQLLAAASDDGGVRLWRTSDGVLVRILRGGGAPVRSVVISPDGRHVVTAMQDGSLEIWRIEDRSVAGPMPSATGLISRPSFSPDGQLLAATQGQSLMLWQAEDARILRRIDLGTPVAEAVFVTDDVLLVRALEGVWRIRVVDGARIRDHGLAATVDVSGSGAFTALGRSSGEVIVEGAVRSTTIRRPTGMIRDVALSWDGRVLAVIDADGTVTLWGPAP